MVKIDFISVDAAMRVWINGVKTYIDGIKPGQPMKGSCVAEVLGSRSDKFKTGDLVLGFFDIQSYQIISTDFLYKLPSSYLKGDKERSKDFLGVLGTAGQTAYFGFFKIGQPKKGETVVVSAASGSVGEIVVQLAKNLECKVVCISGSDDKNAYLLDKLKADACINYNKENVDKQLREICPEGVDIYFDNVGGQILDDVLMNIRERARIVLCGAISQYNQKSDTPPYRIKNYMRLIIKKALMQGFVVIDYVKEYPECFQYLNNLIVQKKLIFREHIIDGIQNFSSGLQQLLTGKNQGKVIVSLPKPKL